MKKRVSILMLATGLFLAGATFTAKAGEEKSEAKKESCQKSCSAKKADAKKADSKESKETAKK